MNAIYMVYLPLLIISLIKVTDAILAKYFQKSINISLDVLIAFNIYNAIIACIYFSAADGFKIGLNGITMLFSLVYAFAVASNHLLTFLSYSKTSVSFVSIVSTAGTIIVSTMFGLIFLDETLSLKLFVSLVLLVLAVIIPGFDLLKDKSQKNSIPILVSFFLISGALTIIPKLYAGAQGVCSSNSFFFMTNVIMLLCAILLFFIQAKGSAQEMKRILKIFSFSQLANIGVRNIICDISAIITVAVLKYTDISIFSIVTYSMILVISFLASKFYFKEEIKLNNIISLVLTILAIIINPV